MKLALRIFTLTIVFVGAAAASVSPATMRSIPSHLSATGPLPSPDSLPIPCSGCVPH
jgi:hypothetical protein